MARGGLRIASGIAFLLATVVTAEAAAQVVVVERRRRPVYVRRVVLRVPEGYHLEERPRTGLIVTGAVLTGIGGVFVTGAIVDQGYRGAWRDADTAAAIVGGIFLAVGLPLLITGATTTRLVMVRNSAALAPIAGPHMAGAAFIMAF
jgi:hypothetical protein